MEDALPIVASIPGALPASAEPRVAVVLRVAPASRVQAALDPRRIPAPIRKVSLPRTAAMTTKMARTTTKMATTRRCTEARPAESYQPAAAINASIASMVPSRDAWLVCDDCSVNTLASRNEAGRSVDERHPVVVGEGRGDMLGRGEETRLAVVRIEDFGEVGRDDGHDEHTGATFFVRLAAARASE
jgi:hypothetical protein